MTINMSILEKNKEILINKIIELFKRDMDLFHSFAYYKQNYGKLCPIIKKGHVFYVTEFFEGQKMRKFLTEQEEWHKIYSWKELTECSLQKLGIQ